MDLTRRPVDLAVALVRTGADVVVVGGTARLLTDGAHVPRDLDVAVEPSAVAALVGALGRLGTRTTAARLLRSRCSRLTSSYGPLDVFVGRLPPSTPVPVDGRLVRVAR